MSLPSATMFDTQFLLVIRGGRGKPEKNTITFKAFNNLLSREAGFPGYKLFHRCRLDALGGEIYHINRLCLDTFGQQAGFRIRKTRFSSNLPSVFVLTNHGFPNLLTMVIKDSDIIELF